MALRSDSGADMGEHGRKAGKEQHGRAELPSCMSWTTAVLAPTPGPQEVVEAPVDVDLQGPSLFEGALPQNSRLTQKSAVWPKTTH